MTGFGARADDVYAALLSAHDGRDDAASQALNARLLLVLLNALDDPDRAMALIAQTAREMTDEPKQP